MNKHDWNRSLAISWSVALILVAAVGAGASAAPTFISQDPRLPNPDQPYIAEGNFAYGFVAYLQNFKLWATNRSQLDFPSPVPGGYEFASMFDVAFSGVLGVGLAPPVPISGTGEALAAGMAPGGTEPNFVFDTELVAMHLTGAAPLSNVLLRESPTLESSGVTTVEGGCYGVCPPVVLDMRISSFFDVFTELSLDGGQTWIPSVGSTRIVQTPEPGTGLMAALGALAWLGALSRKRPN